ncbi:MAG: UDP-N-acetylmuramate--L-alanine ligase, partial [Pedobacter sp.]
MVYVDDYAHHPEELRPLLTGAKSLFNNRRCTIIFQPHLFTRTRDFAEGFAEVLAMADQVILLPIYPAREQPIEGVDSEMLARLMNSDRVSIMNKEEVIEWVKNDFALNRNKEFGELLITAGAGDIDTLVPTIKEILD